MRLLSRVAPLAVVLGACGSEEGPQPIPVSRTYVPVPAREIEPVDSHERFGYRRPTPAATQPGLAWTTPDGWQELPPQQFRDANFAVPEHPDLDVYLTLLPGAGEMVADNVNRWRRQLGQPALSAEEIAALPERSLLGAPGVLVDVEGAFAGMGDAGPREGWRLVGVVANAGGDGVTLKMVGPAEAVAEELGAFEMLRESFHRSGARPPGHPPAGSATAANGAAAATPEPPAAEVTDIGWDVPAGWEEEPGGGMRLVTLHPGGREDVECAVFLLAGDGGGEVANVQRWVQEMGRPAPSAAEVAAMPTLEVMGRPARLIEAEGTYTGMGGQSREGFGLLGLVCELGSHALFVKMTGPAEVVRAERGRFEEFCLSLAPREGR